MQVSKSIFKYIEHELYSYAQTKKDLAEYREQILDSSPASEVAVQSGLGNITENKAIKLTSSAFVIQAERVIDAVDKSLAILGEKHEELFKLKYLWNKRWQEITIDMDISDRTYYRLRRELVLMVGQKLGLVNVG